MHEFASAKGVKKLDKNNKNKYNKKKFINSACAKKKIYIT